MKYYSYHICRHLVVLMLMVVCHATLSAQRSYDRVVSLVPSVSQSISQLGAMDRLVGCTSYCTEAVQAGKPVVATVITVQVERVAKLRPDLVVVSSLTNPKDVAAMRKLGLEVIALESPSSFAEICSQYERIGAWVGAQARAQQIVADVRTQVRDIERTHAPKHGVLRPTLFFQIGVDPIFAVLQGTFMDDYITLLGYRNAAVGLRQGAVGREYVVAQDPDAICVTTMGVEGKRELMEWKKLKSLSAVRRHKLFVVPSEQAAQPTPLTFLATLKLMERELYP